MKYLFKSILLFTVSMAICAQDIAKISKQYSATLEDFIPVARGAELPRSAQRDAMQMSAYHYTATITFTAETNYYTNRATKEEIEEQVDGIVNDVLKEWRSTITAVDGTWFFSGVEGYSAYYLQATTDKELDNKLKAAIVLGNMNRYEEYRDNTITLKELGPEHPQSKSRTWGNMIAIIGGPKIDVKFVAVKRGFGNSSYNTVEYIKLTQATQKFPETKKQLEAIEAKLKEATDLIINSEKLVATDKIDKEELDSYWLGVRKVLTESKYHSNSQDFQ